VDLSRLETLTADALARAGRTDADAEELDGAIKRAFRYLSHSPRTERQVRDKLAESGFGPPVVEGALTRLIELGLIDDFGFSRSWITERAAKGRAPDLLLSELKARGVRRDLAEAALAEFGPNEEDQAIETASSLVRRVSSRPLPDQARRLGAMLARRGFSPEACRAGVKAVLPPEGWD
jgi:regulatory protein